METSDSAVKNRKEGVEKMLRQLDDVEEICDSVETDVFDHKARNAALQNGDFIPPSGTIFEAVFQELKRKKHQEKSGH